MICSWVYCFHQKKVVLRKEHGTECWVFFYGEAVGRQPQVFGTMARCRIALETGTV